MLQVFVYHGKKGVFPMFTLEVKERSSMDISILKDMFPLLLTGLTALTGGLAWLITRMDQKDREERKWQVEEREKLEKQFATQIISMREEIRDQNSEINQLRSELTVYARHVGILEGLLKAQGVEPPSLIFPTR